LVLSSYEVQLDGNSYKFLLIPIFSLLRVFSLHFAIYTYFTHIAASTTVTDGTTN